MTVMFREANNNSVYFIFNILMDNLILNLCQSKVKTKIPEKFDNTKNLVNKGGLHIHKIVSVQLYQRKKLYGCLLIRHDGKNSKVFGMQYKLSWHQYHYVNLWKLLS